jgi:hypothetical protein
MSMSKVRAGVLAGLLLGTCLLPALAGETTQGWQDNERKFKSNDPDYNLRRSEHFRILWGKGAGKEKNENADFSRVTEELAQGSTHDFGGANVAGHAIKDGDCCNGANVDHQVLMCWVWGTDQKYADTYTVSADGAGLKVMPQTVGSATRAELNGREVTVKGCIWTCGGEKRVVWAEVK